MNRPLVLVLAALVAGGLLWLAWPDRAGPDANADGTAPTAAASPRPVPVAPPRGDTSSAPVAASAALAAAPAAAASAIEVCGFGQLPTSAERSFEDDPRYRSAAGDALERLLAALRQRGDPPSTAAALLLSARAAVEATRRANVAAATAACGRDEACVDRFSVGREPATNAARSDVEALVRLATGGRDPFVYAMALDACAHPMLAFPQSFPACDALGDAQWAAIDSDNAVPWLRAATAASQAGDRQAVDAALHRASQARSSRIYGDAVYGLVVGAVPADAGEAERTVAHLRAVEAFADWTLPAYETALQWCSAAAVREPGRRSACVDLATRLAERGSTLIDLGIGIAIARRLDPAPASLGRWMDLRDALAAATTSHGLDTEVFGCAAVAEQRRFLSRASSAGERVALGELLAASGMTAASAVEQTRRRREAVAAEAAARRASESAASAARPASAGERAPR